MANIPCGHVHLRIEFPNGSMRTHAKRALLSEADAKQLPFRLSVVEQDKWQINGLWLDFDVGKPPRAIPADEVRAVLFATGPQWGERSPDDILRALAVAGLTVVRA